MLPEGTYTHNDTTKHFISEAPVDKLTTDGQTTGPSAYVIQAGIVDKDKPSELDPQNELSVLRARLTLLQDDVNSYLTQEMAKEAIHSSKEDALEQKLLDGADSDSDNE